MPYSLWKEDTHRVRADLPGCPGPPHSFVCTHLALGGMLQTDVVCPDWKLRCNLPTQGHLLQPPGVQDHQRIAAFTLSHTWYLDHGWVKSSPPPPTSLVAKTVENLPTMQETQVWPLGREYSLGKGMATYSSILAWKIPWTEEPGGLQSVWLQRVRRDWVTSTNTTDSPGEWAESLPTWGGECCCHTPRRVTTEHVCSTPWHPALGTPTR